MPTALPPPSSRGALLLAILAYFVVKTFVPFGGTILYPLTLLATWIHEMGHGLTALAVGGHFERLEVFGDASGLAHTATSHPWQSGLTSAGGLVAPPIVGALLLMVSRGPRRARVALALLAATVVVSLAVWVRSLAGWIALPIDAAILGAFAAAGSPRSRMVFAQLVGITLAIDTVSRADYLFSRSATIEGISRPSDVSAVADAFGGSYLVWGLAIGACSLAFLAVGLRLAWRDQPPRAVRSR
jgi:hypothetical protein